MRAPELRTSKIGPKIGAQPGQGLNPYLEHLASLNGRSKGFGHMGSQKGLKRGLK